MSASEKAPKESNLRVLLKNFLIELGIYAVLVLIYFYLVLQYLETYLTQLFEDNLVVYGIIGLLLIVLQGAFLDAVTSFLLSQIKLERLD